MGQKITMYIGTSASFSEDLTEHRLTCPTGKQWTISHGYCKPDVNATLDVDVYDSSDQKIGYLLDQAASTNAYGIYPLDTNIDKQHGAPIGLKMGPGDYVRFKFGANQGAAVVLSLTYVEEAM